MTEKVSGCTECCLLSGDCLWVGMVRVFIRKSTLRQVPGRLSAYACQLCGRMNSCTDRVILLLNNIKSTPSKAALSTSTVVGNYPINKSLQTSISAPYTTNTCSLSFSLMGCVSGAEPTIPTMAPDWNAATKDYRIYQKASHRITPYLALRISGDMPRRVTGSRLHIHMGCTTCAATK